ncbi:hypothetical protein [Nocardioides sp. MH1]|uniref:hypothetical protein n=1 Tax=Nocardioides sp. MH1 TaxID=3242490 RepID=UPI00352249B4
MRPALLGMFTGALAGALIVGGVAPARAGGDDPVLAGSVRAHQVALFDVTRSDGTSFAARIHADGTGLRRLTRPSTTFTSSTLSPDRTMVALRDYPAVIDVADPTGAGRHNVFTSTENQFSYEPVWSPDSRTLLMTADRGSGPELLAVPVDGGAAVHLAYAGATAASNVAPAGWSPDGSVALFLGTSSADGTERPAYLKVSGAGGTLRDLPGWEAYAARPRARTGIAVVRTSAGADIVQVGARLAVRRTLMSVGPAEQVPELVWSADGRRFAVLHGDPGHQRVEVLSARGRVVQRIRPRQPRGGEGLIAVLGLSSGGSIVSWSYANYVGAAFTRAEGLFVRDIARRRTCRKAPPGAHVPWAALTYAPDDRYAVVERDGGGVRGLLGLGRPSRIERVRWSGEGTTASNVQFLHLAKATVATRPCR